MGRGSVLDGERDVTEMRFAICAVFESVRDSFDPFDATTNVLADFRRVLGDGERTVRSEEQERRQLRKVSVEVEGNSIQFGPRMTIVVRGPKYVVSL
jgi:hypothetical protein